jgi:hypothetical protein
VDVQQPVAGGPNSMSSTMSASVFAGISARLDGPVEQDPVLGSQRLDHPVAPGN